MSEINDLSLEELQDKVLELSETLFLFRSQKKMGKLDKPLQIRFLRRDIARIKTFLNEKSRQEGRA